MTHPDPLAIEHVRRISKNSGSSFLSAIKRLPAERRDAMYSVYAFCREVDDIADGPLECAQKCQLLVEWRKEIDKIFICRPCSLTGRALVSIVIKYNLKKSDFLDLIDGMEMDANEIATKAPNLKILDLYCDRVASAVGRLTVRIFGDSGEDAQRVATSLGRALQLTNILRDILEDSERNRLYLPSDLLEKYNIETRDPSQVIRHPNLKFVCSDLKNLALNYYTEAEQAMAKCSKIKIRPAVLMMQVYRRILKNLVKRGWTEIDKPVKVPKLVKLWILIKYGFL